MTAIRVMITGDATGPAGTFVFLSILAAVGIYLNKRYNSDPLNPRRHYGFFILMLAIYSSLGFALEAIFIDNLRTTGTAADQTFQAFDKTLDPNLLFGFMKRIANTWPPMITYCYYEILSLAYLLLLPIEAAGLWFLARKDVHTLRLFSIGLFTLHGVGFLGYTIKPAVGPIAIQDKVHLATLFNLSTPSLTEVQYTLTGFLSIRYDAFPSLHIAISLYILTFCIQYRLLNIPYSLMLGAIVFLVSLSSIALGYHYFLDSITGVLLVGVGFMAISVQSYFDRSTELSPPA